MQTHLIPSSQAAHLHAHQEAVRQAFVAYVVLSKDPRLPTQCAELSLQEYCKLSYETTCRFISLRFRGFCAGWRDPSVYSSRLSDSRRANGPKDSVHGFGKLAR